MHRQDSRDAPSEQEEGARFKRGAEAFTAAVAAVGSRYPSDIEYRELRGLFEALTETLTKAEIDDLWSRVRRVEALIKAGKTPAAADRTWVAVATFSAWRTRRRQASPQYKEQRKAYNARYHGAHKTDPHRQDQLKQARARYRAKQKAARLHAIEEVTNG